MRISIVLLSFFLSSCTGNSCREWIVWTTETDCPQFNSGRMFLSPDASSNQIELEIDRGPSGIKMYLNLFCLPVAPLPNDPTKAAVELLIEGDESRIFYPIRYIGGQRLLCPEDIASLIIEKLLDEETVVIKIGRNKITVIPDNFADTYQALINIPL